MDLLYTVWKEQRFDKGSDLAANNFRIRKSTVSGDGGRNGRLTDRFMSDPGARLSLGNERGLQGV
jgi:hypothetical protein